MDKKSLGRMASVAVLIATAAPLRAYENTCTHPVMANQALTLLQQKTTAYYELQQNISNIRFGETDEDNPLTAVLNHFYDPETQTPLTTPGFILSNQDAVTRAQGYFNTAVQQYNNGTKSVAYAQLGRVLHLTQDMAQPGHVQNDPHVPYLGVFSDALPTGLNGSGASPLEASVEQLCQTQIASFPSGNSVLTAPAGLHNGGGNLTASDFLEITARTTYLASSFHGNLSLQTINLFPIGVVTIGSGTVTVGSISYAANFVDVDTGLGNQCMQIPHWEIVGSDGVTLCYDPSQNYSGSVFSGFTSNWWQIPNSPSDPWNPGTPLFYFHTYNDVSVGSGGTLTNVFTNTMVPSAINSTAGLLQFFGKTVDPIKPTIQLHNNDANGAMIQPGGFGGGTIFVHAVDPGGSDPGGDPNFPTPSGVYQMILTKTDTGDLIPLPSAIAAAGENPADRTFSNLQEGPYTLQVLDGLGNATSVSFTVSHPIPPAVTIALGTPNNSSMVPIDVTLYQDFSGPSGDSPSSIIPSYSWSTMFFQAVPAAGDSMAAATVTGPKGFSHPVSIANGGSAIDFLPGPLDPGDYVFTAIAVSGSSTTAPFTVAAMSAVGSGTQTCNYKLLVDQNSNTCAYSYASSHADIRVALSASLGLYAYTPLSAAPNGNAAGLPIPDPPAALYYHLTPGPRIQGASPPQAVANVMDNDGNELNFGSLVMACEASFLPFACDPSNPPADLISNSAPVEVAAGPYLRTELDAGDNQTVPIGMGAEALGVNVINPGAIGLVITNPQQVPPDHDRRAILD